MSNLVQSRNPSIFDAQIQIMHLDEDIYSKKSVNSIDSIKLALELLKLIFFISKHILRLDVLYFVYTHEKPTGAEPSINDLRDNCLFF